MKHSPFVQVNLLERFISQYVIPCSLPELSLAAQELIKEVNDPGTEQDNKIEDAYRKACSGLSDGALEVDDDAVVSFFCFPKKKGAYVAAWIWVSDNAIEPEILKLRYPGWEENEDEDFLA